MTHTNGGLVINEVFYLTTNEVRDLQFIELFNASASDINVSGYSLRIEEQDDGEIQTITIPSGTIIASNSFYLIGGLHVETIDGLIPDIITNLQIPRLERAHVQTGPAAIVLNDSDEIDIDALIFMGPNSYDYGALNVYSGVASLPPYAAVYTNRSITRTTTGYDSNDVDDWTTLYPPTPKGSGDSEAYDPDDPDRDGLTNAEEDVAGTDSYDPDSDGDGVSDYDEVVVHETDPLYYDSDMDGLWDYTEIYLGLNPNGDDSDLDGLDDANEDADGDGVNNQDEQDGGSDPGTPSGARSARSGGGSWGAISANCEFNQVGSGSCGGVYHSTALNYKIEEYDRRIICGNYQVDYERKIFITMSGVTEPTRIYVPININGSCDNTDVTIDGSGSYDGEYYTATISSDHKVTIVERMREGEWPCVSVGDVSCEPPGTIYVLVNENDSDENQTLDTDDGFVDVYPGGDPDLRGLGFGYDDEQGVSLNWNSSLVRLYEHPSKRLAVKHQAPMAIPADAPGSYSGWDDNTVYVEGIAPGESFISAQSGGLEWGCYAWVIKLDLDIDSDNDNGLDEPDRDNDEEEIEASTETNEYGKIVIANNNDDDMDGIPDYADLDNEVESNFIPVILEMGPTNLVWSEVELTFSYNGASSFSVASFGGTNMGHGFTNYTAVKTGAMRLWMEDPGRERDADSYVVPNQTYNALDLGLDATNTLMFYVEGLNASEAAELRVNLNYKDGTFTAEDKVRITVVEPNVNVNNSNNDSTLLPGDADRDFTIDSYDDRLEDQGEGFVFWPSRDLGGEVTPLGVVDLMPIQFTMSAVLTNVGYETYVQIETLEGGPASVYFYPYVGATNNLLSHLQDQTYGNAQVSTHDIGDITCGGLTNKYLMKWVNPGVYRLSFLLAEPGGYELTVADSVKITIKEDEDLYWFGSTRGDDDRLFNYPLDPGVPDYLMVNRFPDVENVYGSSTINTNKEKYFVFIHGFNVPYDSAVDWSRELYRRLYWTGYRDNYLGITWKGDDGDNWPLIKKALRVVLFFQDVNNALHTSPSVYRFVKNEMIDTWNVPSDNINIMAHSLGNLVMWDALRINQRLNPSEKIVNNIISLEAAVWEDTFLTEEPFEYDSSSDHYIEECGTNCWEYSVDELKKHSWAFWFQQSGYEADLSGNEVYHSYVPDDSALTWMRRSDYWWALIRYGEAWHYYRDEVPGYPGYRTPESLYGTPVLMEVGERNLSWLGEYDHNDLQNPLGRDANPKADVNQNATELGWGDEEHSDIINLPYYLINEWYSEFLKEPAGIPSLLPAP